ncbi:MAG: hypothetical protein R6V57_00975 [Vicinamibacterales bacterium]
MDPVAEIKRLYYATTRVTVQRDLEKAVALLKTLKTEEERERVSVFMDGLSQMRSEWGVRPAKGDPVTTRKQPDRRKAPRTSGSKPKR